MHRFLEWHASQFMTKDVKTVTADLNLHDLEALFDRYDFNAFPVMDGERVAGLVTKFDFLKAFIFTTNQVFPHYDNLMKRTVGEVMTKDVASVDVEAPLTRVLELMIKLKARSFPVLNGEYRLAGMISREDLMRALHLSTEEANGLQ